MAMGGIGRTLRRIVLVVGAGVALSACHQNGTVFAVDTTADTIDANPGDGLCADSTGACSVRAAVMEANALPGVEEIALTDGVTYVLTRIGIDDTAVSGDLDILAPVVITGEATIESGSPFLGRLVHVRTTSGLVEIDGPDLVGGNTALETAGGAAILHEGTGNLSVLHSDIRGNAPGSISPSVVAAQSSGTFWLWSSTVHDSGIPLTGEAVRAANGVLDLQNTTIEGTATTTFPYLLALGNAGATVVAKHVTVLGIWHGAGTIESSYVQRCVTTLAVTRPLPTSGGRNVEPGTSCGFTGATDRQNTAPGLGPITDDGSGVQTARPQPTSPLIDTAASSGCTIFGLDARGISRPVNSACDVGAVELEVGPDCASPGNGAQMQYCDLVGRSFSFLDMTKADLTGADHTNGGLHLLTDFTSAVFVDTDLTNANLSGTTITGADFTGATMTSLRATNLTGAAAALPTDWRQVGDTLIGPFGDVIGADFSFADLSGVVANDLESAGVAYVDADLGGAVFDRADFTDANLKGADTTGASFVDALWDDTVCPDGTFSTTNVGKTCAGHL